MSLARTAVSPASSLHRGIGSQSLIKLLHWLMAMGVSIWCARPNLSYAVSVRKGEEDPAAPNKTLPKGSSTVNRYLPSVHCPIC